MFRSERENEILSVLSERGYSTVAFLSKRLDISQSSMRRDLAVLESKGLVSRSYGGVQMTDTAGRNVSLAAHKSENKSGKMRIAAAAASLVKEGDTVFVDGSGTAFFMFPELVKIKGITVVTNSIDGLHYLSGFGVKAISTGGMISPENRSALVGSIAEAAVGSVFANITFFSAEAVSDDGTVYCGGTLEVPLKNAMMKNSHKRILLCDKSILGQTSAFRQCALSDVNCVISDSPETGKYADGCPGTEFVTV